MGNQLVPPVRREGVTDDAFRELYQFYGLLTGQSDWGAPIDHTGGSEAGRYIHVTRNLGGGGAQKWLAADGSQIGAAPDTGFVFSKPITGTSASFSGALSSASLTTGAIIATTGSFSGALSSASLSTGAITASSGTFSGALSAASAAISGALSAASATIAGLVSAGSGSFSGAVAIGGTLGVTGITTVNVLNAGNTNVSTLTSSGLATLESLAVTHAATVGGDFRVSTNAFVVDAAGNKARVNLASAIGTADLSVGPNGIATSGDVTATGDLNAGDDVVAAGDLVGSRALISGPLTATTGTFSSSVSGTTGTFTGTITGGGNVDIQSGVGGQIRVGGVIVNQASFDATEKLLVNGDAKFKGNVVVTGSVTAGSFSGTISGGASGDFTVTAGDIKLDNTHGLFIKDAVGNSRQIVTVDGSSNAKLGYSGLAAIVEASSITLSAATSVTGTFNGSSTGAFVAGVSGTTGTFSGAVSGTSGTFSLGLSAGASSSFTGGVSIVSGGLTVIAGGATITGAITGTTTIAATAGVSGTTGTFSAGVSGTTGTFSGAVSGTTGTFSSTVSGAGVTSSSGVTVSAGNLAFSTTGQRITGDFSTATIANRPIFQSSAASGFTTVSAIPASGGVGSAWSAYNNATPTSGTRVEILINSTEARLSVESGGGGYVPLKIRNNGADQYQIDTDGRIDWQNSANYGTGSGGAAATLGNVSASSVTGPTTPGATDWVAIKVNGNIRWLRAWT